MRSLTNEQLRMEHIPEPDCPAQVWVKFAHTIKGYEVIGSFEACANLANNDTATTLTELRCVLFFEARRERHSGGRAPTSPQVRRLLRRIRAKVSDGELD